MHPIDEANYRPTITSICKSVTGWYPHEEAKESMNASIYNDYKNINFVNSHFPFNRFPAGLA